MTNIGTPDWQRGVVTAGKMLASVPAGTGSITVELPPNACTLVVMIPSGSLPNGVDCVGGTTGMYYPGTEMVNAADATAGAMYAFTVSPETDPSVGVQMAPAPTVEWYVYAGNEVTVVSIAEIAKVTAYEGQTGRNHGITVLGNDGSEATLISTDSNGRIIPMVPTESVDVTLTGASDSLLAAPASGRWYLFGFDVAVATGTAGVVTLSAGGVVIATAQVGTTVNLTDHVDLGGFATGSAVTADGPANIAVTLRYAPGP